MTQFTFLGEISWKPMSISIMAFSKFPLEESLMWVVKVTYFTVTSCFTSFLEVVLSTFFIALRMLSPFTVHNPCPNGNSLWSTILSGVFSRQPGIHVPETLLPPTYTFSRSKSNLGEVQGCSSERERIWVRMTLLTIRLMRISIGRGSRGIFWSLLIL